MAAALQKEMNDSMTVEATMTLVALDTREISTGILFLIPPAGRSQISPTRLADGLGLESTPSSRTAPLNLGSPVSWVEFGFSGPQRHGTKLERSHSSSW